MELQCSIKETSLISENILSMRIPFPRVNLIIYASLLPSIHNNSIIIRLEIEYKQSHTSLSNVMNHKEIYNSICDRWQPIEIDDEPITIYFLRRYSCYTNTFNNQRANNSNGFLLSPFDSYFVIIIILVENSKLNGNYKSIALCN